MAVGNRAGILLILMMLLKQILEHVTHLNKLQVKFLI